jgi:hypothetical protein
MTMFTVLICTQNKHSSNHIEGASTPLIAGFVNPSATHVSRNSFPQFFLQRRRGTCLPCTTEFPIGRRGAALQTPMPEGRRGRGDLIPV